MIKKRRCSGETKAGKPCRAAALKGGERCAAHPLSPAFTRFGSPEQAGEAGKLGGRPRHPRVIEVMRELVEADIERILRPYFEAIDNAIVTGTFMGQVIPSEVADLAARIQAAEKLLDRVYGKPRQVAEITGAGGGPIEHAIDLRRLTDEELNAYRDLIARAQSRSR